MKSSLIFINSVLNFIRLEPGLFFEYVASLIFRHYPKGAYLNKLTETKLLSEIKSGKSLIRIGDGESLIMTGRGLHFQNYQTILRTTLKKMTTAYSNESNYLLAVPFFALEESFAQLNKRGRARIWRLFRLLFRRFPKNVAYADAVSFYHKDSFLKILSVLPASHELVILSKADNDTLELKQFLDEHHPGHVFTATPSHDAFASYQKLKATLLDQAKDHPIIVITAMGPAGKVLAYELSKEKIQCIDLGHGIEILGKKEDYSLRL